MKSGIYKIENLVTGRVYIGQSVNIDLRWYQHKTELKARRHANKLLQSEWNQHGEYAFIFQRIEDVEADKSTLSEREKHWIGAYRGNCYNWPGKPKNTQEMETVVIRLSEPEKRAMMVLAGSMGIGVGQWFRKMVRNEYEKFFGQPIKE